VLLVVSLQFLASVLLPAFLSHVDYLKNLNISSIAAFIASVLMLIGEWQHEI
jgi:hypothetical protein